MNKRFPAVTVFLLFLPCLLFSADYNWDLISALIHNDFGKTEKIIEENINIISTPEKRLILSFALTYSSGEITLKVLELLLKNNIFPNSFDLYTAINRNQSDILIQFLLDNGSVPNGEILLLAMEKQKFNHAKKFIELGVDVNYQYPLSRNYSDGMTPLLYASRWNNFDLVKLLIEKGADINVRAQDGSTALSLAGKNENSQIMEFLRERGALETAVVNNQPPQSTGISGLLSGQTVVFQTGTYRLSGGNIDIGFAGSANSGRVSYFIDGRAGIGVYRIDGSNLTVTMEGQNFIYKLDTAFSFSGNGEVWVRTGN